MSSNVEDSSANKQLEERLAGMMAVHYTEV